MESEIIADQAGRGTNRTTSGVFNKVTPIGLERVKKMNTKQLIKKYKQLKLKFCLFNKDLWFNTECKKRGLTPKYILDKLARIKNVVDPKMFSKFSNVMIKQEISTLYSVRDSVGMYVYKIRERLVELLHIVEWDIIDNEVRSALQHKLNIKQTRLSKKLSNLIAKHNNTGAVPLVNKPFDRTVNLTDVEFSNRELKLMNKGLNYCPRTGSSRSDLINLVATVEASNIDKNIKLECATELNKLMSGHNFNQNINLPEKRIIKSLCEKINKQDLVILKADKGHSTVVMNQSEYLCKTMTYIEQNECVKVEHDPTIKFDRIIKGAVSCSLLFQPYEKSSVTQMNPLAPRLYGQPKLHKEGIPVRPVVSTIGAPAEKLSKKVAALFRDFTHFKGVSSLKNSYELVHRLDSITVSEEDLLVSFDIQNMFGSVPPQEAVHLMKVMLLVQGSDFMLCEELGRLIDICLEQNYFRFNGEYYQQENGLAMGSSLSPLAAEVFLDNFEKQHILSETNPFFNQVKFWARYVDDTICLWGGGRERLEEFLLYLSSRHERITFTMETEDNGALNYLDLKICKKEGRFEYGIFRKSSWTDTVIPADSNHHQAHKHAAFHALIHRALTIPLTENEREKEFATIRQIAISNGYEEGMVQRMVAKKRKKLVLRSVFSGGAGTQTKQWYSLPFIGSGSQKIGKILNRSNYKVSYKSIRTLKNILSHPKDRIDPLSKNGVYRVTCAICGATYTGQSGRKIGIRMREHMSRKDSKFFQHLETEGHQKGDHTISLMHMIEKGCKMTALESLEILIDIQNNTKCLNVRAETPHSPFLQCVRLDAFSSPLTASEETVVRPRQVTLSGV